MVFGYIGTAFSRIPSERAHQQNHQNDAILFSFVLFKFVLPSKKGHYEGGEKNDQNA